MRELLKRPLPAAVANLVVVLLSFFVLCAVALLVLVVAGQRAAAAVAFLFLPWLVWAAWIGYFPGLLSLALIAFVAPRLFNTRQRPPDPVQLGLLATSLVLTSRLADTKRRTARELEERVAERTLQVSRSEAKLREQADLLNLAHEAIFTKDLQDVIQFWSRGAAEIYGWTEQEAVGKKARELLKSAFSEPLDDIEAKLLATGFWHGEITHETKSGSRRVLLSRWALRRDVVGAPSGVLEINTDITEARRVEEKLRHAQRMESIGQLAGGVAHDFNNLLGAIIGFSELTLDQMNPSDPLRRYQEEIKKAGEKAVLVTRQLLAFSRKQVLQPRILNLAEVTRGMEVMLRRLIGEHIQVAVQADPETGQIKADSGQIEQIIMNLAVNARDAMPRGGKLSIGVRNAEMDDSYVQLLPAARAGSYVLLVVSDTGCGMDAATKERIFEPFFTTKPEGKGTGLGLATVYGIVQQNGGNIWVYSEPGIGSTFKVYLPRVEAAPSVAPVLPKGDLRGAETLLVVEDADSLRDLAREFLTQAGYRVLTASDAVSAMKVAEENAGTIHLLLTDVIMPGPSGAELAVQMKRVHPETRVLFMSGYTDDALGHHGVLDEGVMLLEKPFTRNSLLLKVREVFERPALTL